MVEEEEEEESYSGANALNEEEEEEEGLFKARRIRRKRRRTAANGVKDEERKVCCTYALECCHKCHQWNLWRHVVSYRCLLPVSYRVSPIGFISVSSVCYTLGVMCLCLHLYRYLLCTGIHQHQGWRRRRREEEEEVLLTAYNK